MKQLKLTTEELLSIGFDKKVSEGDDRNPSREFYAIGTINGFFYYNPDDTRYAWYHKTIIGETANDVHLDIAKKAELFVLLHTFKCEFQVIA